jgi:hypothetical protein
MVKLDVDTLPTVPDAPPAAGPDRALDPPLPDNGPRAAPAAGPAPALLADAGCAVVEEDVPRTTETAITAHVSAPATIQVIFFDSNRRTLGQRACVAKVTEADEPDQDAGGAGGAAPVPPEPPATHGPDAALGTGRTGRASWELVGS